MGTTTDEAATFDPESPEDWARRWTLEFQSSKREVKDWHAKAEKIIARFRDERDTSQAGSTRWNLFTANIQTVRPMLYGQTPKVSVERRFADAQDDVARVAATMLERLLNADIEKDSDSFARALKYVLDDRLLPGLGLARIRYVAEFEEVPEEPATELAPAVPASERKSYECVETDYVPWTDVLWSAGARVWDEVRWLAFGADMAREALVERFGELGRTVPLNSKRQREKEEKGDDPWGRARVWEIWDKDTRQVFWFVEGFHRVLDVKPDPLELDRFFPCPEPFLANVTTSTLVPVPDFVLAQDFYLEIDKVSGRIALLEDAIRVAGVYDKSNEGLKRLLTDANRNELIPVENWAALSEKGGIAGAVDWLPLEQIVKAVIALRDYRRELVDALFQATGMSDIMRGQAATAGASATEQALKARFGSVRIQALQDEFARFASDLQRLKAEVVAKHFSPETIIAASNVEYTPDAEHAQAAVELIQSRMSAYRVQVKPESVSLTDFAALKSERMEVLAGLSQFLTAAAPLMTQAPASTPFLLQMLQWSLSGLKGSSGIESVLDDAIHAAQQAAMQPAGAQQPDTKLLALQMKGQQDERKVQLELQADLARESAKVQADAQREQNQAVWNVREQQARAQIASATRAAQPKKEPS